MTGKSADFLLRHMMQQKLKRQQQIIAAGLRPLSGRQTEKHPKENEDGNVLMTETRIYIGLNDSETREQKFETEKYLGILKDVCRNYHVAFSVDVEEGGYYHEDGEYTEETSLVLILIDAERNTVQEIAKDLRAFFHQESVLVTENRISGYFIGEETQP